MFQRQQVFRQRHSGAKLDRAIIKGAPESCWPAAPPTTARTFRSTPTDRRVREQLGGMSALSEEGQPCWPSPPPIIRWRAPSAGRMTFVGMVGHQDELRPEAVEAIRTAKRAGIQVVMVTGDKKRPPPP